MNQPDNYLSWYQSVYPSLTGHGLWLRGNSLNALDESFYGARQFHILIARLSTSYDTAESFSHKVLYQIARKRNDTFPDFAFLPPVHDGPIFSREGVPWLLGVESKRGPAGFDVIAFSNAVLLELVNVIVMMERSGIPLEKSRRLANKAIPLIILGGANAHATSAFYVAEPPVDGIFAGESVECIANVFAICAEAKRSGLTKRETLDRLAIVPGFIEPDRPRTTRRAVEAVPSLNDLLHNAPVLATGDRFGTGNLQISEGCACMCGFCSESFCRKPYREVAAADVLRRAAAMKAGTGLNKVDLYSFNFNMHSEIVAICEGLLSLGLVPGLKSQRFDMLARDAAIVPLLRAVGKTSLTCGLEGISGRLRKYLHKSLSDADIRAGMAAVASMPLRELKVFLIITGLETSDDVEEFETLLQFIKSTVSAGRNLRVIFSATLLVRFPWTPLEFEDAPPPEDLKTPIALIRRSVEQAGFEFRLAGDEHHYFLSQILARASDSRVYAALVAAIRSIAYVYYRAVPSSLTSELLRICAQSGLTQETLLSGHSHEDATKPWLFVHTGVSREYLCKQHDAARACADNGFCLGGFATQGACAGCGACDDKARERITTPRTRRLLPASLMTRTRDAKSELSFVVDAGELCRGLPRANLGIALARAIMIAVPHAAVPYAGYSRSFWSAADSSCWTTGRDIITLVWQARGVNLVEQAMLDPANLSRINEFLGTWGTFVRMWDGGALKWTLAFKSPFPFEPKSYFAKKGLPYTLRKTGEGNYSFDFSPKALKKKLIGALTYSCTKEGGSEISASVFDKFDPEEFVKNVFAFASENDWVRVNVTAREA
jgi:radical SAM superfamily enzyme YgiQ (UPF0313 family)